MTGSACEREENQMPRKWRFLAISSVLGFLFLFTFKAPAQDSSAAPKPQAAAKSYAVPRTPDGHPDLQGIWSNQTLTPFERPSQFASKAYFTKEEAFAFETQTVKENDADRRNGQPGKKDAEGAYNQAWWDKGTHVFRTLRTSMVIDPPDGLVPPMTPEAKKKFDEAHAHFASHPADGPEDRFLSERCVLFPTAGPPMLPEPYNSNYEIVQTHDYVTIMPEMNHDVRMIPMDGRPHLPKNVRQWKGDPRGHWEGDTLVVETTNFSFNDKPRFGIVYDGWTDQNLQITERFTRTSPDAILYRATIVDPTAYTKPWTVELVLRKVDEQLYEYACHEGNYGLFDILSGGRADDKKAESK
jgi:hypothetical protein